MTIKNRKIFKNALIILTIFFVLPLSAATYTTACVFNQRGLASGIVLTNDTELHIGSNKKVSFNFYNQQGHNIGDLQFTTPETRLKSHTKKVLLNVLPYAGSASCLFSVNNAVITHPKPREIITKVQPQDQIQTICEINGKAGHGSALNNGLFTINIDGKIIYSIYNRSGRLIESIESPVSLQVPNSTTAIKLGAVNIRSSDATKCSVSIPLHTLQW